MQELIQKLAGEFITQIGAEGGQLDLAEVVGQLTQLLPTENGELDIAGLISQFSGGGLADLAASWLGDGANAGIDISQILSIFGQDKVAEFAGNLGIDTDTAAGGLAATLPALIDQNSQAGDLASAASGMLGKLFS